MISLGDKFPSQAEAAGKDRYVLRCTSDICGFRARTATQRTSERFKVTVLRLRVCSRLVHHDSPLLLEVWFLVPHR